MREKRVYYSEGEKVRIINNLPLIKAGSNLNEVTGVVIKSYRCDGIKAREFKVKFDKPDCFIIDSAFYKAEELELIYDEEAYNLGYEKAIAYYADKSTDYIDGAYAALINIAANIAAEERKDCTGV